MAALTWKNVDAPNLTGAAGIAESSGRAWTEAMGIMGDMMNKRREQRMNSTSAQVLASIAGVTDPEQYQAILANQDLTQVTPEALSMLMSRPKELVELQGAQLSNDQTKQNIEFGVQDQQSQMSTEALGRQQTEFELNKSKSLREAELAAGPVIIRAEEMARNGDRAGAKALLENFGKQGGDYATAVGTAIGGLDNLVTGEQKFQDEQETRAINKQTDEVFKSLDDEYFSTEERLAAIAKGNYEPKLRDALIERAKGVDDSVLHARSPLDPKVPVPAEARVLEEGVVLGADNLDRTITMNTPQAKFDSLVADYSNIKDPREALKDLSLDDRYLSQGLENDLRTLREKTGATEAQVLAAVRETMQLGGSNLSYIDNTDNTTRQIDMGKAEAFLKDMIDPKSVEERKRDEVYLTGLRSELERAANESEKMKGLMERTYGKDDAKFEQYKARYMESLQAQNALIADFQNKYNPQVEQPAPTEAAPVTAAPENNRAALANGNVLPTNITPSNDPNNEELLRFLLQNK